MPETTVTSAFDDSSTCVRQAVEKNQVDRTIDRNSWSILVAGSLNHLSYYSPFSRRLATLLRLFRPTYYVDEDYPARPGIKQSLPGRGDTVAQNRPLWRLMSVFGATHPLVVLATQEEEEDLQDATCRPVRKKSHLCNSVEPSLTMNGILNQPEHVLHSLLPPPSASQTIFGTDHTIGYLECYI